MTKKPKFLKGLLATASTFAVLVGANEAMAVIHTTNAGNATAYSTSANTDNLGAAANGDTYIINTSPFTITVDSAKTGVNWTINAGKQATFTTTNAANNGSVNTI